MVLELGRLISSALTCAAGSRCPCSPGNLDMIRASPLCIEHSRALTRRLRKLEEGDCTAVRTLELIRDLRPHFWCIENPQTDC